MPEEHTLFTVVQVVFMGNPDKIAACLAGAWPTPAERTLPRITYSIYSGLRLICSKAPLMQKDANCGPEKLESLPM